MEMRLRNLSITELAELYEKTRDCSPCPRLLEPKAITTGRRLARKNGIWADLSELDPDQPIPVMKRSKYRNYQRTGDRIVPQTQAKSREHELNRAALALWLGHPQADLDYLQDLLWAYCDDWTWIMAAHEGRTIDLGSARLGATMAEIVYVLEKDLEAEVKARVAEAIEQNIFTPFCNYRHLDSWKTSGNNWNHVCNSEIIRTALYQISDSQMLAQITHPAIQHMTYAIDGFTDDGGCREGPSYWGYGFGHYLRAAYALSCRTNRELDIMNDPSGKLDRICRYPLSVHIEGPWRATFADSGHGHISAAVAILVNFFRELPELYGLCDLHSDQTLKVSTMEELSLYTEFKVDCRMDRKDYLLPKLGLAKLRCGTDRQEITLLCLAGNNGVPHNHNDIGSFMVYKNGCLPLTDPGQPVYKRKTFSAQRYEIPFCNALGHSVPIINRIMQSAGEEYYGSLQVDNLNGSGQKRATIDMTTAYPSGTVEKFIRTFHLDPDRRMLVLEDELAFTAVPQQLEEGFITLEPVAVDGEIVNIGSGKSRCSMQIVDCPGKFSVEQIEEDGDYAFTRIRFVPDRLATRMMLRFEIK